MYTVLADASHRSLELVQDVPHLCDGTSQRNETKANSPRIENPIEGSTSINDQCIQAVRRLKKRYRDLFVIGKDELKPMKGKPAMLEAVQRAHVWLVCGYQQKCRNVHQGSYQISLHCHH